MFLLECWIKADIWIIFHSMLRKYPVACSIEMSLWDLLVLCLYSADFAVFNIAGMVER